MRSLIIILQRPDIEKKMAEAPDNSYEIGVVIGSYLPLVVLAGIAYAIYYFNKKRRERE